MGMGGQRHATAALPPERDPGPIVQESGQAPGPVWTGAENLAPHRDSIPGPSGPVASLSYDRSKASSKASSPHSAIESFLLQMRVSSSFLKVIQ